MPVVTQVLNCTVVAESTMGLAEQESTERSEMAPRGGDA